MENELRKFAVEVARVAGNRLMSYFKEDHELLALRSTAKEAATKYDSIVDQLIIEKIRHAYPDHGILTEESGSLPSSSDWLWIVDSLDGTGNFANQNPFFSVCLALLHKGELTLGVIYAPAINECYQAEKGRGAYLNYKRIHVSDRGSLTTSYLFYCEGGDRDRERTGAFLQKVYPLVTDIRKLGSAGLETAWVAAGRAEAYFTTKIDPWDVAPGVLLVREAGGYVSDFQGNAWTPERNDLLFSNKKVHNALLKILKEAET